LGCRRPGAGRAAGVQVNTLARLPKKHKSRDPSPPVEGPEVSETCPRCGRPARLHLSVISRDEEIIDPHHSWRLACVCGLAREGALPAAEQAAAMLLSVAPVAVLWGVFALYGGNLEPTALRLVTWLVHVVIGMLAGDRLGRAFAARRVRTRLRRDADAPATSAPSG
jgi:hypothetical protein